MKHYEGDKIRLTQVDDFDQVKNLDEKSGIPIKYKDIEFIFYPTMVVKDPTDLIIFAYKFNHKERLILYYNLPHPDTDKMIQILKVVSEINGYQLSNIYEYLPEMYETGQKLSKGEIELEEGVHPNMNEYIQ